MNGVLKDPKPMTLLTEDGGAIEYTPRTEFGKLWAEAQNESVRRGDRFYSSEELQRARDLERAGYDGMGMVWRNEDVTSTQAL
jgi:hypothetical protein